MSRGPDAGTLLDRRLRIAAEAAGVTIAITDSDWVRWSSATFSGARHRVTVMSEDAGLDPWLATLPDADLPMRGHLVAELVVAGRRPGAADLDVLTVEER